MISIITCIYNQSEKLFRSCAESVAAQSLDIEWLIIDDGSDSFHARVIQNVLSDMRRADFTELITLEENRGLSFARNVGLQQAKGDWIVVLDSDDAISEDLSDVLINLPSMIQLVCLEVNFLKQDGTVEHRTVDFWREQFLSHGLTPQDPFLWFDFYYHGLVARADLVSRIGGYNDSLHVGEDQDVLLRACEDAGKDNVQFVNHVGYYYRDNPNGVCRRRWEEVERNYSETMVSGAQRRGADVDACRFVGTRAFGIEEIDEYVYRLNGQWYNWEEAGSWPRN